MSEKGGRAALLQQEIALLQQELARREAELLEAVVPIEIAPAPVSDIDAQAAKNALKNKPRKRRRRRRPLVISASVQDLDRARRALKLKGMLRP